ncbi:lysozyme [Solimonas marina]|uniref:Lysozyme n=1 Tax=Solimonas marina TaxID=2714601 RepID=A0A969WB15_9GAMM|nr:lysozyme [Solimonas marina]NKF21600.1 lysozyme [Solimonas marina]
MLRASQSCVDLIQHFESCELEAYPDPGSPLGRACTARHLPMREYRQVPNWKSLDGAPWTIGRGHTGKEVIPGLTWTQLQADRQFEADLYIYEKGVNSLLKVEVTQAQFDALVSFAYNCGLDIDDDTIAEGLGDSTLLRLVNEGNFAAAAGEFPKWDKSGGRVIHGLLVRRLCEQALFMGEDWRKAA